MAALAVASFGVPVTEVKVFSWKENKNEHLRTFLSLIIRTWVHVELKIVSNFETRSFKSSISILFTHQATPVAAKLAAPTASAA